KLHSLILIFVGQATTPSSSTVTVSDSQGNIYSQIEGFVYTPDSPPGNGKILSAWRTTTTAAGPLTLTYAMSDVAFAQAAILEYSGIDPNNPFDDSNSHSFDDTLGSGTEDPRTTDLVPVSGTGRLLIGAFLDRYFFSDIPHLMSDAGFTLLLE